MIIAWTVPNLLTLARLLLVVPICVLLYLDLGWPALLLYIIAAISDYLDGWWARRYNAGSDFGRMLDPIVDKVFVAALFVMLAATGTLHGLWLACPIIILAREFLIAGLREYVGSRDIKLHVSKLAKWKTTTQMVSLGLLLIQQSPINEIGLGVLLIATFLTVQTAVQYVQALRVSIEA